MVVQTKTMDVCVMVGEQTSLKHFVWRGFDSRYHVCRTERALFNFSKVVGGIAVQSHFANWNERVILV